MAGTPRIREKFSKRETKLDVGKRPVQTANLAAVYRLCERSTSTAGAKHIQRAAAALAGSQVEQTLVNNWQSSQSRARPSLINSIHIFSSYQSYVYLALKKHNPSCNPNDSERV